MSQPEVLVIGAGPVGLALALALARHDVPSVVLDEGDGHIVTRAARTCVLRPDTAALATRLGCASAGADAAGWHAWRTVRRRHQLEHITFTPRPEPGAADGTEAAAPPRHLPQHTLMRELRSAAEHEEQVRLVTGVRLEALEQDATGITACVRGAGPARWRGSYLAGCDGARSTVRKLLAVRFPGRTAVERQAVAALRVELPWPQEALLRQDPPQRSGQWSGEVTARPLPDGQWRLDWLLPPRGDMVTPQALLSRLQETLAEWHDGEVPPHELLDTGVHICHQRLALRWRVGRAFLAGDAAHLLGALGTQSVDEGLRDADNLAWKLAAAWHQGASETLLDSYAAERRGAVGARLRAVDQALPLVRGTGGLRSLMPGGTRERLALLRDGHLGRGPLGSPPVYRRSLLAAPAPVPAAPAGTAVGAVAADVPVIALNGARVRLRDRLGGGLLVVLVAPGAEVWDSRHWLSAGLMPELASLVSALPLRSELLVTGAYPDTAAHTVLLIRPDGHLAATLPAGQADRLGACVEALRGATPEGAAEATARS